MPVFSGGGVHNLGLKDPEERWSVTKGGRNRRLDCITRDSFVLHCIVASSFFVAVLYGKWF